MKNIIFLFILILPLFVLAETNRNRNTIVSATVSQTYFGWRKMDSNRLNIGLRVHPINSLSAGFYYSPHNAYSDMQDRKSKIFGGSLGLHAYKLFEIAGLNYFKDRVDLYGLAFFERDLLEDVYYYQIDMGTGENIKLNDPIISNYNQKDNGIAIGCTYYIINNVGVNAEYRIVTDRDWPKKYLRVGVSFRL